MNTLFGNYRDEMINPIPACFWDGMVVPRQTVLKLTEEYHIGRATVHEGYFDDGTAG